MRGRDVVIGAAYALRPRTTDRLPVRVVATAVETDGGSRGRGRRSWVQWTDPTTGARGRAALRDLLGPWEPHAASDRAATELVDRLQALPAADRWFDAVHVGYGGYANFGVIAHLSTGQAQHLIDSLPGP